MPPNDIDTDSAVLRAAFADADFVTAMLEELQAGVCVVDRERRILYWNRAAENITGQRAHEISRSTCAHDLLRHCDVDGAPLCGGACPLESTLETGKISHSTLFVHHRQGHRIPVYVRAIPVRGSGGELAGAVEIFEQIQAPAREEIAALSVHGCLDEGTGALSRAYGERKLAQRLEVLNRFGIPSGWIRIELDTAAELEHRYGQGMLDAAMEVVARTIDANLGSYDILMRWDRTSLRAVVHNASAGRMAELARKLVALVRASAVEWWGDQLAVTISIGAVMARKGETADSLEGRMKPMLEHCRASGGNCAVRHLEHSETTGPDFVRII